MLHDRRSALSGYVSRLLAAGRTVFTTEEAEQALGVERGAFLDAAERLQRREALLRPRQGFYVIVPPQYASWGAPPPAWYIDALMRQERQTYYVGLLKAAEFHGATHQAVMEFQVISAKRLPTIRAGRSRLVFYFRKDVEAVMAGIEARKTETGTMKISSAALTALDLLRYPQASGGIDNVATVLSDLALKINPAQLAALSALVERPVVQRLGTSAGTSRPRRPDGGDAGGVAVTRIAALDRARPPGGKRPRLPTGTAEARSPLARHSAARTRSRRMIPAQDIVAWSNVVPAPFGRQGARTPSQRLTPATAVERRPESAGPRRWFDIHGRRARTDRYSETTTSCGGTCCRPLWVVVKTPGGC